MSDIDPIIAEIARVINREIVIQISENPTSRFINADKVSNVEIKEWLRDKHSSTWSTFSIGSEDTLEKAANWFKEQLSSFSAHLYKSG